MRAPAHLSKCPVVRAVKKEQKYQQGQPRDLIFLEQAHLTKYRELELTKSILYL